MTLEILEDDHQVDIPFQLQRQLMEKFDRKDFKLGLGLGCHLTIQVMDLGGVQPQNLFAVC